MAAITFATALVILLARFFCQALLPQLGTNVPILFQEKEIFYKLYLNTGITQYIVSHYIIAAAFDVCLFFSAVFFIILRDRIFAVAFLVLSTIYFLSFNIITGHHYHSLIGVLVMIIPFLSKSEKRFGFLWEAARYYMLYVFASAALWKIMRGSVFHTEQLSSILMAQQLDLLLQNPDTLRADIASYFISHPQVSHILLMINIAVQLAFLIGFFTKKWDAFLFWLAIVFVVANYCIMGIISTDLLILNLTLLNWDKVHALWQRYMPVKLQFSNAAP